MRFASVAQPDVEISNWVDTSALSELVADFARVHMLVSLFDGDPEKWLRFIDTTPEDDSARNDLPFVFAIQHRLAMDPFLLEQLRRVVRDFAALMVRPPLAS